MIGQKINSTLNTNFLVKLQPKIVLGRHGASGHHALRLVEMDQEDELGLKQNKKLEMEYVLVSQTKWNPAT